MRLFPYLSKPNVLFIGRIINGGIDSTRDKGFKSPQSLPKVQPIKMLSANAPVNEYEKRKGKNTEKNKCLLAVKLHFLSISQCLFDK